jgi:hypothetical protein
MRSRRETKVGAGVRRRLSARARVRDRSPRRSSWRPSRRLGPLECTMLALIVLGVAITVVMALLDPSG